MEKKFGKALVSPLVETQSYFDAKALYQVYRSGDMALVEKAVAKEADFDQPLHDGKSALELTLETYVKAGQYDRGKIRPFVDKYLEAKRTLGGSESDRAILHLMYKSDESSLLERAIAKGGDFSQPLHEGKSALELSLEDYLAQRHASDRERVKKQVDFYFKHREAFGKTEADHRTLSLIVRMNDPEMVDRAVALKADFSQPLQGDKNALLLSLEAFTKAESSGKKKLRPVVEKYLQAKKTLGSSESDRAALYLLHKSNDTALLEQAVAMGGIFLSHCMTGNRRLS